MNKTIFALLLSTVGLLAQPIVPGTTPWSRAFLRQTNGSAGIPITGFADGKPIIFIVTGDSRNVPLANGSDSLSWPAYLMTNYWVGAPVGLFTNTASGGATAWDKWTNYNNTVGKFLPTDNSVTQAVVAVNCGLNDLGAGSNMVQTVNSISNLCYRAHTNGAKVILFKLATSLNLSTSQESVRWDVNRDLQKNTGYYYDYLVDTSFVFVPPFPSGINSGTYGISDSGTVDSVHYLGWVDNRVAGLVDWTLRNGSRGGSFPFPLDDEDGCHAINAAWLGTDGREAQNVFWGTQKIKGNSYIQGVAGLTIAPSIAGFGSGLLLQDNRDANSSAAVWLRAGVVHHTAINDVTTSMQAGGIDYIKFDTTTSTLTFPNGGNGSGITNVHPIVTSTQTNWISGQLYTNLSGYIQYISSPVVCTISTVAGGARVDLKTGTGTTLSTTISTFGFQSVVGTLGTTNAGTVFGYVNNNQTFSFTNAVGGAGDAAANLPGGQQITY